jgi:hypothetical protein
MKDFHGNGAAENGGIIGRLKVEYVLRGTFCSPSVQGSYVDFRIQHLEVQKQSFPKRPEIGADLQYVK